VQSEQAVLVAVRDVETRSSYGKDQVRRHSLQTRWLPIAKPLNSPSLYTKGVTDFKPNLHGARRRRQLYSARTNSPSANRTISTNRVALYKRWGGAGNRIIVGPRHDPHKRPSILATCLPSSSRSRGH